MAPLVSMRGIDKMFAGTPALVGATLEVEPGEVHALIGQNGAGKSTLVKILTGYHARDAGEILFEGRPVAFRSPQEAQKAGISTIYQEINLVPQRSVTENICLGRERRRFGLLDWGAMHAEARALLARFGIAVDVRAALGSLSTAEQQMVAIARAIGFQAKLVVMDEPTSSLDEREVEILFGVIRQLKGAGVSVLFISHKLDELYAVCDRVTVMRDGRTVEVATMQAVSRLELVRTMLGRELSKALADARPATAGRDRGTPLLEVDRLSVGRKVADVSLSVDRGEIVGLAGLLGSGRSETMRAVFGADPANGGAISLDGRPGAPADPAEAIAKGIGFCSEDRKLDGIVPGLSVRENMTLALMPQLARHGVIDDARAGAVAERFIERLGIRCSGPDQPIRELSGGNQQKVLLARWLCMNTRLLLLDEPTRGIDVGAKAEILSLIRELAEADMGVLVISSELEELIEAATRLFVLRDGRTVAELAGEGIREDAVLAAMAHGEGRAGEAAHA